AAEERHETRSGDDLGRELLQRIGRESLQLERPRPFEEAGKGYGDEDFGGGSGAPVQLPLAPLSPASKPGLGPPLPPARSYQDDPVELPPPPQMIVYREQQPPTEGLWNPPQQQQPAPHPFQQQQLAPYAPQQLWLAQPRPGNQALAGATGAGAGAAFSFQAAHQPPQPQSPPAGETLVWTATDQRQAASELLPTIEQRRAASEALWRQVTGDQQLPGALQATFSAAGEGAPVAPTPPAASQSAEARGSAPSTSVSPASSSAPSPMGAPGSGPDPHPPRTLDSPTSSAAISAPGADSPVPDTSPIPDSGASAADRSIDQRSASVEALQKQRLALRNWRSASYNHALVLLGAARLPRKALAEATKIPGAVWVDRHELVEPSGLPLQVKSVLARALAAQTPACGSCDDNETGRGEFFRLLRT
ncbi:unnamed protein product, partial [Hapterophycus canaliculatus]